MDRKIKRNDTNDKKADYKIKDGSDSKKSDKSRNSEGNMKVYLERGDSGVRQINSNQKTEQARLNDKKTANGDIKSKYLTHGTAERDFPQRKTYDKDLLGKSYSEIRKRIRDKYTFKLNEPMNKSDHLSLYKSRKGGTLTLYSDGANPPITIKVPSYSNPVEKPVVKPLPEEKTTINEIQYIPFSVQTDFDMQPELIPEIPEKEKKPEKIPVKPDKNTTRSKKRKPIIKTIVSKTDSARIFKAVTFVDHRNSTPLEIKIPGENVFIKKQQKVSKYTETNPITHKTKSNQPTVNKVRSRSSKGSIKREEKPTVYRRRPERKRGRIRISSPEHPCHHSPVSPPTEVARWAPASIDPQTKPYYEAWVDTTLTATSKHTKKDKDKYLYEYQNRLLQSFRRALEERPKSPELFYSKFADEKYAGRIKIRQGGRKKQDC